MPTTDATMNADFSCSGHIFHLQKTGQVMLGENAAGEKSALVLMATNQNKEPPTATVFANVSGSELTQDGVTFSANETKEFDGVGKVTLLGLQGEGTASFCFEPDADYTVDEQLTN